MRESIAVWAQSAFRQTVKLQVKDAKFLLKAQDDIFTDSGGAGPHHFKRTQVVLFLHRQFYHLDSQSRHYE